jgi:hypothetical protein
MGGATVAESSLSIPATSGRKQWAQRVIGLSVIATRMKTKNGDGDGGWADAAMPEIGFSQRLGDRARNSERAARSVERTARRGR